MNKTSLYKIVSMLFLILISTLTMNSCTLNNEAENSHKEPAQQTESLITNVIKAEPSKNLRILENTLSRQIIQEDNGDLILPENGDIQKGSILISQRDSGFARKVMSLEKLSNGKIKVKTQAASLNEIFEEADFDFIKEYSPDDVEFIPAEGVEILSNRVQTGSKAALESSFNPRDLRLSLPKNIHMDIKFESKIKIEGKFKIKGGVYLKLANTVNLESSISLCKKYAQSHPKNESTKDLIDYKRKIGRIRLPKLTIWAGPVPLVFFPKLEFYSKISGEIYAEPTIGLDTSIELKAGVEYKNDEIKPIKSIETKILPMLKLKAAAAVIVSPLSTRISLALYDSLGLYIDADPYVKVECSTTYDLLNNTEKTELDVREGFGGSIGCFLEFPLDIKDPIEKEFPWGIDLSNSLKGFPITIREGKRPLPEIPTLKTTPKPTPKIPTITKAPSQLKISNVKKIPAQHSYKKTCSVYGQISSNYNITKVTVMLANPDLIYEVPSKATVYPNKKSFNIKTLDSKIKFAELSAGKSYTFSIYAEDSSGKTVNHSQTFKVVKAKTASTLKITNVREIPATHTYKKTFSIYGSITSNYTIKKVVVMIANPKLIYEVPSKATVYPNTKTYNIKSIDSKIKFAQLVAGQSYTFSIYAEDSSGKTANHSQNFKVSRSTSSSPNYKGLSIKNLTAPSSIHKKGRTCSIYGTIQSQFKLASVHVGIIFRDNYYDKSMQFTLQPLTYSYNIHTLDPKLKFGTLKAGQYNFYVSAKDIEGNYKNFISKDFQVK